MSSSRVNVLLVDDEPALRQTLRICLEAAGFAVSEAQNGAEALEIIRRCPQDLILLDVNMPGIGGIDACRQIRALAPDAGILMITVRDREDDKVEAFEAGADDYLTKPFGYRELAARLQAVLRRTRPEEIAKPTVLRAGKLELDLQRRVLLKDQSAIRLSPTEFKLLAFLMQHKNIPLTHTKILRAIWGPEYSNENEYLRVYVRMLRKKIEDDPAHPEYLRTEPWLGYKLRDPVEPARAPE